MIGLRSYKIFYTENKKYINNQTQLQVCRKGYNCRPKMVRNNFRNKISGNQMIQLNMHTGGPNMMVTWSHPYTTPEYDFSASTWLMTHVCGKPNMWFQTFKCKQKKPCYFPYIDISLYCNLP